MRAIFTGILLFLLWATFARWYYVCKIKGHCHPTTEEARRLVPPKTLGIYQSDSLLIKGYEQFIFDQSSVQAQFTSNNTSFLNQLVKHLQERNELEVRITGFFLESEKDQRSNFHQNLGEARAASLQEWLQQQNISSERIHIQSQLTEGERLIEPLKFHLFHPSTDTAGS